MVEDHIKLTCESLAKLHKSKPRYAQQYLSASHIPLALEHLKRLPKFKHPLPKHQPHYEAVKDVVTKIAGSDKPKIVTNFLRSQFPSLRAREASCKSIFDQADQVSSNITSSTYTYEMKKLLDKFTRNQAADFL